MKLNEESENSNNDLVSLKKGKKMSTFDSMFNSLLRSPKSCLHYQRKITVEPVLFLFNMATQVVWITSQDLMIQKACRVNLEYEDWMCGDLSSFETQESKSQRLVSSFLMWRSILETSLRMVAVPILGWWGDEKGYKGPLIFSLVCLGLESTSFFVNAVAEDWPLGANLLSSFFYGMSGGTHALLMIAFSFMAQKTSVGDRTLRIGILDGFYYLGSPIGLAISAPLFDAVGYLGIFGGSMLVYLCAVIYVVLRLPKNASNAQNQIVKERTKCNCSDFGVDRFWDAFYAAGKPRPNRARVHIWLCILAMLLDSFVIWGESNVKYLFTQNALDWDYAQYSHYGSFSSFLTVIGALVMVPTITLNSKLADSLIGLIGSLSRASERLFYIFATEPSRGWFMYVGSLMGMASPLAPIAIRSQISKLAPKDVAQVYAVMAIGESLLPFISSPVYNAIYEASLEVYPGAFYILSCAINLLMGICFTYLFFSMKAVAS